MDKKVRMAILLDLYCGLLTDKQKEAAELYFEEDLSLSEIAENTGVTRQAVRDAVAKAEKILVETEEKTGLCERITALETRLNKINSLVKINDEEAVAEIARLSETGE